MATIPFPHEEIAKVLASNSSGNPLFLCSDTIHDSKAENKSDVDNPPSILPNIKYGMDGICSIKFIIISKTQKIMQPSFLPH
mmetsp:Transcript_2602/g.2715  ORF Transcript_2602/g.2715 Transcript_2602/m.2715 type:complete len:82 (-) Transcript_2602:591-836(-)